MYEYRVIPAPARGKRAKGARTPADRFSVALQDAINELAVDGWEYHRAETLPFEERSRLGRKSTGFHSVLIFRRLLIDDDDQAAPPGEYYFPPPEEELSVTEEEVAYVPENTYEEASADAYEYEAEAEAEPVREAEVTELRATRPGWLGGEDSR